jgi:hypothetical protein
MSFAMSALKTMKVKEVPQFLKTHITKETAQSAYNTWWINYKRQYIDTSSSKPIVHFMTGIFVLSYTLAWPTEYAHWKHARDAQIKGEKVKP